MGLFDELMAERFSHGLRTVFHTHLLQYPVHVCLNRPFGNEQILGDLIVSISICDLLEDIEFPLRQFIKQDV
jgi:hypothetical protein